MNINLVELKKMRDKLLATSKKSPIVPEKAQAPQSIDQPKVVVEKEITDDPISQLFDMYLKSKELERKRY